MTKYWCKILVIFFLLKISNGFFSHYEDDPFIDLDHYDDDDDDIILVIDKRFSKARVSRAELSNLTETLFSLECFNDASNWLEIDVQGKSRRGQDMAPKPLLRMNGLAFEHNTIQLLERLYDNYSPDVRDEEKRTPQILSEEWEFLNAVMATPIFQEAQRFLISKNFVTAENIAETIHRIWFGQYCRNIRGSRNCHSSSGFEHIFLGEFRGRNVAGFHNWLYFADQEMKGLLNYLGYSSFLSLPKNKSWIQHSFTWRNHLKPISSMFIGTTPEFELTLYSLCWLIDPRSRCRFTLNGNPFTVQTFPMSCEGNQLCVGSTFADAERPFY